MSVSPRIYLYPFLRTVVVQLDSYDTTMWCSSRPSLRFQWLFLFLSLPHPPLALFVECTLARSLHVLTFITLIPLHLFHSLV